MDIVDVSVKFALASLAVVSVVFFVQAYIRARKQYDQLSKQQ